MHIRSVILIVAGLLLLGWGVGVANSIGPAFSRSVFGTPSDTSFRLLLAGFVVLAFGSFGAFRFRKA